MSQLGGGEGGVSHNWDMSPNYGDFFFEVTPNTVWLILICIILNHKDQNIPINFNLTCERIKREIRDTTRAHPMSNLAMECKNLSLREFLASHEAKGIHWTSHKTSAKIQY